MTSERDTESSPLKRSSVFYRLGFISTPTETDRDDSRDTFSSRSKRSHSLQNDLSNDSLNSSHNSSTGLSRYELSGYNSSPATTPSGRDNKAGWYDIHEKHAKLASYTQTTVVLSGDSIIAGLTRYPQVWNRFFKPWKALNFGIGGDRTQHVLWRAENIELPTTTKIAVIHCGTNNIDRDKPLDIANGIISIGLTFQEMRPELKIIVTGLLPRDLDVSYRRDKINKTNRLLKKLCRGKLKHFYYMKQDTDWTLEDGKLNEKLYYSDCLHLIETGNEKFAKSIANMLYKVSEGREIEYSSDEGQQSESETTLPIERAHGERRHKRRRSRSPDGSFDSSSGSRKRRRSNSDEHKRKVVSQSPFKWSNDRDSKIDESTPNKWSSARKWSKVIKQEYHDKYKVKNKDSSRSHNKHRSRSPESAALAEKERLKLEARTKRFATSPLKKDLGKLSDLSKAELSSNSKTPSALVVKIQKSIEKTRKALLKQKLRRPSLVSYSSPSSQDDSQEENTHRSPAKLTSKKFFSDYASDSETE